MTRPAFAHWRFVIGRLRRQSWVRSTLYCFLGVGAALSPLVWRPELSDDFPFEIDADAAGSVLTILAATMLTVTTFSLSTMLAAHNSASRNGTPRAVDLLIQDSTAQNSLAIFLAVFLFGITSVITLKTGLNGPSGRLMLFSLSIVAVLLVTITLLRWIDRLTSLGRVSRTIDRLEQVTRAGLIYRRNNPCLGGVEMQESRRAPTAVYPQKIGYIQHIDMAVLQAVAAAARAPIDVAALPGTFTHPGRPIAFVPYGFDDAALDTVRVAFLIGGSRTFEQDPRLGLIALSEIASRALCPGNNDPGTAIDVIGTAVRVLAAWAPPPGHVPAPPRFPMVRVPCLETSDLLDDIVAPIARDGGGLVEIGLILQKALAILKELSPETFAAPALAHSVLARRQAEAALALAEDRARIAAASLEGVEPPSAAEPIPSAHGLTPRRTDALPHADEPNARAETGQSGRNGAHLPARPPQGESLAYATARVGPFQREISAGSSAIGTGGLNR